MPIFVLDSPLLQVSSFPLSTMFGMCSFFLVVCLFCQKYFASIIHQEQAGSHFNEDDTENGNLVDRSTKSNVNVLAASQIETSMSETASLK